MLQLVEVVLLIMFYLKTKLPVDLLVLRLNVSVVVNLEYAKNVFMGIIWSKVLVWLIAVRVWLLIVPHVMIYVPVLVVSPTTHSSSMVLYVFLTVMMQIANSVPHLTTV